MIGWLHGGGFHLNIDLQTSSVIDPATPSPYNPPKFGSHHVHGSTSHDFDSSTRIIVERHYRLPKEWELVVRDSVFVTLNADHSIQWWNSIDRDPRGEATGFVLTIKL